MRITKYIFLILISSLSISALAQNEKFQVYGAGRFYMQNSEIGGDLYRQTIINGDTLAADTVNARKEMTGYALFDLGFQVNPNPSTEIRVLTRVTSDLDGFWGAGIGFGFRELYIRGLVKGKVRYRVGDLDLKMTPFTLYNSDADLGQHRMSSLHVYEDIIQYEQFYRNNRWRQQGVQTDFKLRLPGKGNTLGFDMFLAKNRQTDFFFTPDRLIGGGSMVYGRKGFGEIGYNLVGMFDVAQTAQFSEEMKATTVHTINAKLKPVEDLDLIFYGEGGISMSRYEEINEAPQDTSDVFFQLGVRRNTEDKLRFYGEYLFVRSGFRSPGAQSRRIVSGSLPQNFSFQGNNEAPRAFNVFDVLTDVGLYNLTITPELQPFLPAYNNVSPYGDATPNRQGLRGGIDYGTDSTAIRSIKANLALLTEVNGEGTSEFRNFTRLDLSGRFALNELYGGKNRLIVELGGRYEATSRDAIDAPVEALEGIGEVDLTSIFLEAGISFEVTQDLFLELGVINLNAEGTEYMAMRNAFSEIADYQQLDIDLSDQTVLAGMKYTFNQNTHLLIQGRSSTIESADIPRGAYDIQQLVVLFNIFF
ncbi:MAG: hypothetical protein MK081_12995 [Flavobacteriales bacterium]|nr:hypothetical protein [Flavobacteriales bacterium]